jgi:hypothetical protein
MPHLCRCLSGRAELVEQRELNMGSAYRLQVSDEGVILDENKLS